MKKAYFQYYETFENIVSKIKDIEEREHFRKIIINYGLYGIEPAGLSELEDVAWAVCKDLIDQQQHRREVNAANRRKQEPQEPAEEAPKKDKAKKFEKPTVEAIAEYCKEKGYTIDAQQFFNYYESNGWKIGRANMKNWRAAVQNWNTRDKAANKAAGTMWANNSTDTNTESYEDLF